MICRISSLFPSLCLDLYLSCLSYYWSYWCWSEWRQSLCSYEEMVERKRMILPENEKKQLIKNWGYLEKIPTKKKDLINPVGMKTTEKSYQVSKFENQ